MNIIILQVELIFIYEPFIREEYVKRKLHLRKFVIPIYNGQNNQQFKKIKLIQNKMKDRKMNILKNPNKD
jgi:hypothetical protein